jgi:uncharacterized membrane protein (Fun14 family)
MTFLNIALLAGGLAFLIPLLIHLLNKRKVVTVRWGAMHLLHEVIRQKKRKMKIEQLLLLITRVAASADSTAFTRRRQFITHRNAG